MDNDLFEIINILNDNNFIKKVDEEFDKKVSDMLNTDSLDEEISVKHDGNPFYVELNSYCDPTEFDKYLQTCLSQFKKIAISTELIENKLLQSEISKRVFEIRTDLNLLRTNSIDKKYDNFLPLIDVKISYCDKILSFISKIKNETKKLTGKKPGSLTSLTQKQIVILFRHLYELEYVGKGMLLDDLARLVSEMTNFSYDKIRQDLSLVKPGTRSIDSAEFKETDYIIIKRALRSLIESIEKDFTSKFPPMS